MTQNNHEKTHVSSDLPPNPHGGKKNAVERDLLIKIYDYAKFIIIIC